MERLFENFDFIKEMDEDLDELCDTFITEVNNRIYEKLLDNYPNYRDFIHQKTELADILFKDKMKENAAYNAVRSDIEIPVNTANFLLGIKLGMKLQA